MKTNEKKAFVIYEKTFNRKGEAEYQMEIKAVCLDAAVAMNTLKDVAAKWFNLKQQDAEFMGEKPLELVTKESDIISENKICFENNTGVFYSYGIREIGINA